MDCEFKPFDLEHGTWAITLLQGPRTDSSQLMLGLRNCVLTTKLSTNMVLYDREGQQVEVHATFAPNLRDEHTLAGCLLEVSRSDASSERRLSTFF